MKMQVTDGLSAVFFRIQDEAKSLLFQSLCLDDLRHHRSYDVFDHTGVRCGDFHEVCNMRPGNDQNMNRRCRVDIFERDDRCLLYTSGKFYRELPDPGQQTDFLHAVSSTLSQYHKSIK